MKRKSSIHIESGSPGNFNHNPREYETINSIFSMDNNEVSLDAKSAIELYRKELRFRTEAYTARTKQKLQKNSFTLLSAVINLEEHHTLKDLDPLIKYIQETLDTKVIQTAVHKDEGFEMENGEKKINAHAHFEMMGIDSLGRSIRKKLTRKYLIELQTITAQLLGMPRGGGEKRKRKRLGTYEYKEAMRRFDEERKQFSDMQHDLENQLTYVRNRLDISLKNEKINQNKLIEQKNSLINKTKLLKKKDEENTKLKKQNKQITKDAREVVGIVRNVSKLVGFEINDGSQLDELFKIIQEKLNASKIKSTLFDMDESDKKIPRNKL